RTFWYTNVYGKEEYDPNEENHWYTHIGALNATPLEVVLSDETFTDARYYEARTNLEASNTTIASGADLTFRVVGGGTIRLEEGFVAAVGSDFRASAEDAAGGNNLTVPSGPSTSAMQTTEEPATQVRRFELWPAAPNPFIDVTVLRFTLPEPVAVRLVVYDLLGREVARLVDDPLPEGAYHVRFDASNLAAGVYVVRLLAAEEVSLIRVTRLR